MGGWEVLSRDCWKIGYTDIDGGGALFSRDTVPVFEGKQYSTQEERTACVHP